MKDALWFLGIDLGTGSCKSVVVDEKADILGFAFQDYGCDTVQTRWNEQNPRCLLESAIASARNAVAQAGVDSGKCAGLSIGGALHSLLALDRHGDPLTGVITWTDGRAVKQAETMRRQPVAERLYQQSGCPIHGMYPLYKIMWIKEHLPDVFRKAWKYVTAKEYVFTRLTGEYRVDYCLAAGSGLLNTRSLDWDPLCLDAAGIRYDQLSAPESPLTVHHGLDPQAALEIGIRQDLPVVLGSSDAANSSLGAGAVFSWQATCMIGTSGAYRALCPGPILDPKARTWCYAVDKAHWLIGGAINNGGIALSWFRDCLNQALSHSSESSSLTLEDVLSLSGRSPAGAGGVICLPFLAGERSPNWNMNARAAFFGLSLAHGAPHLCRALLEGIAFRFKNLNQVLSEVGIDVKQVIASGGFTRSDFWLQIITDALNREMIVPEWGETSCLGAAFWAMLGTGRVNTLEGVKDFVKPGTLRHPREENAVIYEKIYPIYINLYRTVSRNFNEIAGLQCELKT